MVVSDGMDAMLHPNSDCRLIMTAMICVQSVNPMAIYHCNGSNRRLEMMDCHRLAIESRDLQW